MKDWEIERLRDWKIERLNDWEIERLTDWKIDRLKDWQIDRLTDWQIDRLKDWQIDRLTDWKIEGLTNQTKYVAYLLLCIHGISTDNGTVNHFLQSITQVTYDYTMRTTYIHNENYIHR